MDAPYYNGEDNREFGIDPYDEQCPDCGVGPLVDCLWYCRCTYCERGMVQQVIARGDVDRKAG
jgi:hypothetical protein